MQTRANCATNVGLLEFKTPRMTVWRKFPQKVFTVSTIMFTFAIYTEQKVFVFKGTAYNLIISDMCFEVWKILCNIAGPRIFTQFSLKNALHI